MSRYGHESERQAFSYMDGVPVKISEQYKPPRKVTLPVSYQHRFSIETAAEEYDFALEHSVLQKMGEWRKGRKAAVENRRERIKTQEGATCEPQDTGVITSNPGVSPAPSPFSTAELSGGSYASSTVASVSYPEPPSALTKPVSCTTLALTPVLHSISYCNPGSIPTPQYSILTPVPITQSSIDTHTSKTANTFNISDFEADTSSPFDNMELKTINEMEELAHVLQPLSDSPSQIRHKPCDLDVTLINSYASPVSVYNVDQVTLCNTFESNLKKGPAAHTHINGLTGYSVYGTNPRLKQQAVRNDSYFTMMSHPYDYSVAGMPLKSECTYCYPGQTWAASTNAGHVDSTYTLAPVKQTNHIVTSENSTVVPQPSVASSGMVHEAVTVARSGYSTLTSVNHPSLINGASFPSTRNSSQDQHSPGRTLSKSVPDIVQELEKELKNKHGEDSISSLSRSSHTPPPRPNSFGSTGLENWKPWPDLDSPEQPHPETKKSPSIPSHSESKPAVKSTLLNPFEDLSPTAQNLVKHISEMGFSLPRVARACQLLGEDDKKVVEFLLQIQCLEEKNYPGDQAERALIVNRYNVSHAVKYLEAMVQLLDLGFPEDLVSDALVTSDNDRDRALDQLIS